MLSHYSWIFFFFFVRHKLTLYLPKYRWRNSDKENKTVIYLVQLINYPETMMFLRTTSLHLSLHQVMLTCFFKNAKFIKSNKHLCYSQIIDYNAFLVHALEYTYWSSTGSLQNSLPKWITLCFQSFLFKSSWILIFWENEKINTQVITSVGNQKCLC